MTYEDKNILIFDGQTKDSQIVVKQGEIFVTYADAYGKWIPVFHKDVKENAFNEAYVLKQQLKHVYEVDPEQFLSMVELLNPNGKSYKVVKEVLSEKLIKLETEIASIKEALKTK